MISDTVIPLPRRPDSARTARTMAREACADHTPAAVLEDVLLVVSELVTNAVVHGEGDIRLRVQVEADRIVVRVRDAGLERPRVATGSGADGGSGIALVAAVSRDWGVRSVDDGKEVWCVLSPAADGAAPTS